MAHEKLRTDIEKMWLEEPPVQSWDFTIVMPKSLDEVPEVDRA